LCHVNSQGDGQEGIYLDVVDKTKFIAVLGKVFLPLKTQKARPDPDPLVSRKVKQKLEEILLVVSN